MCVCVFVLFCLKTAAKAESKRQQNAGLQQRKRSHSLSEIKDIEVVLAEAMEVSQGSFLDRNRLVISQQNAVVFFMAAYNVPAIHQVWLLFFF